MKYRRYTVNIRLPAVWPFWRKELPWMTHSQLVALEDVAGAGRAGVLIFGTEINLATIRSLLKRDCIDTRRGGRVVATRLGRWRLRQPWPEARSRRDHAPAVTSEHSNVDLTGATGVSEGD